MGAGRRLHEGGKGLHRESDGAGHQWDGPTTGPKAQEGKLVVYASADQKNGGASGVGDGAQEAAEVMGWDFRILDGQGSVPARTSALSQAIALNPDGIILGTIDAAEQAPIIEQAIAAGIKVVGWHAGGARARSTPSPTSSPTSPRIRTRWPRHRRSTPWSTPEARRV